MRATQILMVAGMIKQAEHSYHHNPLVAAVDPTGISAYRAGGMRQVGDNWLSGLGGGLAGGAAGAAGLGILGYKIPKVRNSLLRNAGKVVDVAERLGGSNDRAGKQLQGLAEALSASPQLEALLANYPGKEFPGNMKELGLLLGAGVGGAAGSAGGSMLGSGLQARRFNKENPAPMRAVKKLKDRVS